MANWLPQFWVIENVCGPVSAEVNVTLRGPFPEPPK